MTLQLETPIYIIDNRIPLSSPSYLYRQFTFASPWKSNTTDDYTILFCLHPVGKFFPFLGYLGLVTWWLDNFRKQAVIFWGTRRRATYQYRMRVVSNM